MGFFYFTRKIMLTVAGTIVTYELVMMQFNQASEDAPFNLELYCEWVMATKLTLQKKYHKHIETNLNLNNTF
jgi:hypothetical protein